VPAEYVFGLRRVELRAREGLVGHPFGGYLPGERAVVLYSVPREWRVQTLQDYQRRSMRAYGAAIDAVDGGWRVWWSEDSRLEQWFAYIVLFHELGHHFDRQYRRRRGEARGRRQGEIVADVTAVRIFRALMKEVARRKRLRAARERPA
jgi:hypothetical protein